MSEFIGFFQPGIREFRGMNLLFVIHPGEDDGTVGRRIMDLRRLPDMIASGVKRIPIPANGFQDLNELVNDGLPHCRKYLAAYENPAVLQSGQFLENQELGNRVRLRGSPSALIDNDTGIG